MSKNTTKRSLLASVFALVLCVAMLVGSTFAWFTDTATTGVNKIQSGKLDVKLSYLKDGKWEEVDENTNLFQVGALWEPGHTEVAYLKVENPGNLALKYKLSVNVANEVAGKNASGDDINLSDYIKMGAVENQSEAFASRELARDAVKDADNITTYTKTGNIAANGAAQYVALVVYMPETVGNEANYVDNNVPSIDLGVTLVATQDTVEKDSFDNKYDEKATYPVIVTRDALNSSLTLDDLKDENGNISPVEVTLGDTAAKDIAYSENATGYTGKGVMLGSTNLNKYNAKPAAAGEYKFTFKDGTINSAATGYASIDGFKDTSVYMLVPGNSDVVFENMTFNGVVSFDIQKYTGPWSNLNSITFKNCTFNGIIIGTCPASNVTFDGCTFNSYTNTSSANNSNPIWWREDTEGSGANANPIKTFTFVNNKVTGTRPVKIERVGYTVSPVFTIKNNEFDITPQGTDTVTKNMAINIGMGENPKLPFTLIDEGNTISANTAALYTASLSSGSNQYKEMSGMKVLDGSGNSKVITAMVWKTTTGETFHLKTVD